MKRFLSAFLAVFIFLSCFSVSAFAADSGELVCPDCSSSLVDSSVDVGIFVSHHYKCTNCDYERSFMDLFGWNIGQSGSLSDPVYKDGNITYTVPGNGAGRPRYTSIDCDFISPNGYPAFWLVPSAQVPDGYFNPYSVSGRTLYLNIPISSGLSTLSTGAFFTLCGTIPSVFKPNEFQWYPSTCFWKRDNIPAGFAAFFIEATLLSGKGNLVSTNSTSVLKPGIARDFLGGLYVSPSASLKDGYIYDGARYSSFYSASYEAYVELQTDDFGHSLQKNVSDNEHVNTANNSIAINGNVITYNTAYYDNGVYYIYTDNGVTTYYTDNSGNIYGDVTYQGDTYYITIYNQPEPTPSPSLSPTPDPDNPDNPPTPTPDPDNPNPTPKPTPGGGGSGDSGSSGPSWWDKLVDSIFGAISDFFEGVVKAALKGLWKLLSAILKLPFFIGELFTKLFPFVPGEIATFCVGGFGVLLLIVIIKFIRG